MTSAGTTARKCSRCWPTASDPYIDPVPNAPYMEYTLLHLTPAS